MSSSSGIAPTARGAGRRRISRQGEWKLALGLGSHGFSDPRTINPKPGEAAGQLYNLKDDTGEKNSLWLRKPEIVARLTALLEKYQREGRSVARRRK